jgi:membrane-bound metal-dependent hydrolase YbcI (DUF457 family)
VFLGHYAVGLGAKKLTPYTSLGTLLMAAVTLDLLWPTFLALGLEQVRIDPGNTPVTPLDFVAYPWSHSLLMSIVWAVLFAGFYLFFRRYPRGALVVAALVVSHWVLDLISHRPDLPLWPWGGPRIGMGLWYSPMATAVVEGLSFALGIWLYATNTEPVDNVGRYAFVAFVLVLAGIYAANVLGPPPPDVKTLTIAAQGQWLFVAWGYWLDRHRVAIRQW